MTNECDVLREEVAMLEAEIRRLIELLKVPAYPEAAVRAVWEHAYRKGRAGYLSDGAAYPSHAEEVCRIFVEELRDA